ncbi:hypothetical protein HMPREF1596_03348, partial [Escherichia coli 907700]
ATYGGQFTLTNYLQVPSIDWSDSGYIQHFINVIEKMPTTNK